MDIAPCSGSGQLRRQAGRQRMRWELILVWCSAQPSVAPEARANLTNDDGHVRMGYFVLVLSIDLESARVCSPWDEINKGCRLPICSP